MEIEIWRIGKCHYNKVQNFKAIILIFTPKYKEDPLLFEKKKKKNQNLFKNK